MATNGTYQVYISRFVNNAWESYVEMEDSFPGLRYKSCTGIENQGEVKTYSEEYPETSVPRVYLTNKTKPRDIELKLLFDGADRFAVMSRFVAYITGYKFKFKDSIRNIVVDMYLSGEVKVDESKHYGHPYLIVTFPCISLNGSNL